MKRLFQSKTVLAGCAVLATLVVAGRAYAGQLEDAREALVAFEWQKSYDGFSAVAKAAKPKSEEWAQATFGAAVALSNMQPASKDYTDNAVKLYTSILSETPQSKYAPRATLNLGRLRELRDYAGDKPDLDGAIELYLKVASTWPDTPLAGEATLRAAAAMVQAYDVKDNYAKVKQGIALLEARLAKHPNDPLASGMWQYLGDTYFFPLNDSAKSLAAYDKADSIGWIDKGNEGPLLWRCAILSERIGNSPSAIRYYTKIILETPNSGKGYEAQLALKRLGAPVPEINIYNKSTKKPATTTATTGAAK